MKLKSRRNQHEIVLDVEIHSIMRERLLRNFSMRCNRNRVTGRRYYWRDYRFRCWNPCVRRTSKRRCHIIGGGHLGRHHTLWTVMAHYENHYCRLIYLLKMNFLLGVIGAWVFKGQYVCDYFVQRWVFVMGMFNCIKCDQYNNVMCAYMFRVLNLWLSWDMGDIGILITLKYVYIVCGDMSIRIIVCGVMLWVWLWMVYMLVYERFYIVGSGGAVV